MGLAAQVALSPMQAMVLAGHDVLQDASSPTQMKSVTQDTDAVESIVLRSDLTVRLYDEGGSTTLPPIEMLGW